MPTTRALGMRRVLSPALAALALVAGLLAHTSAAHASDPPGANVVGNVATWGDRDPDNDFDGNSSASVYADNYFHQQDIPPELADKQITAVAASGRNSMALDSTGKVYTWGDPGATDFGTAPPASLTGKVVTAIDTFNGYPPFSSYMMALDSTGHVYRWGATGSDVPDELSGKTVTAIAAAGATLALTDEDGGKVYAWGYDIYGNGTVPAAALSDVVDIAGEWFSSLALKSDGTILCWGQCAGTIPAPDPGRHFVDIAAGGWYQRYIALDDAGKVYTWGNNAPPPPAALAGKRVVSIDSDDSMMAAVTDTGEFFLWGYDGYNYDHGPNCPMDYDACTAADNTAYTPADVAGRKVAQIAVGASHIVAALQTPIVHTGTARITGTPQVGRTLTATTGAWQPDDATISIQWLRDSTPIDGATGAKYTARPSDLGKQLRVSVTATRPRYGDLTVTSGPTASVKAGRITAPRPTLTGKAKVGKSLHVAAGKATPAGTTMKIQWLRNGKAIKGAAKPSYKVTKKDRGKKISARVTRTKTGYTALTLVTKAVKAKR